jgi:hypothetical protein
LVARGLSKEGVDQLLAMGAETGVRFAEELLGGSGDAISEVNKIFGDLQKMAEKSSEKVASGFMQIGEELGADFIAALASKAHEASKFTDTIKRLVALGLSPNNIRMVLEAGVEAGSKIALAIEKGGVDTVRQMNELESSLRGQADNLATLLNDTFYKTGFDLATQIVEGLEDKIETLNETLADMTIAQLKDYLKKVQGEFDAILKGLPNKPADGGGGGGGGGVTGLPTPIVQSAADLQSAIDLAAQGALGMTRFEDLEKFWFDFTGISFAPFAKGGLVTAPTLGLIGEAGPEAVIPLNRMGNMGGQTVINLTVNAGMGTDGKSVGDAIVNELKRWSRKNGKIPVTTT